MLPAAMKCGTLFLAHRFKRTFEEVAKGKVPPEVSKLITGLSAASANNMRKEFQTAGSVCPVRGGNLVHVHTSQVLTEKVKQLLTRTVKAKGVWAANAVVSFCPSSLETANMLSTEDIRAIIPL